MSDKACTIIGILFTLLLFIFFILFTVSITVANQEAYCDCKQCETCGKVVRK